MPRKTTGEGEKRVLVRLPEWLYAMINELADEDSRSTNSEIKVLLTNEVARELYSRRHETLAEARDRYYGQRHAEDELPF